MNCFLICQDGAITNLADNRLKSRSGRGRLAEGANTVKVVILCGGQGTRLREETETRPKPMIEIGGRPILWHIMKIYAHYGHNEFVICLGYKGHMIRDYFLNYKARTNDFTIDLANPREIQFHNGRFEEDWRITMAETGEVALTGARVRKIKKYIDGKTFLLTYGDGVADINIERLMDFHFSHGKIATVTGVRPMSRFGEMVADNGRVLNFAEKPQTSSGIINGGFFVFDYRVFGYLDDREDLSLEGEPLHRLVDDGQLMVYNHDGFWQPMDTYREYMLLNRIWNENEAPWRVWE